MCNTHYFALYHYGDPLISKSRVGQTWQTENGYLKRGVPGHPLADSDGSVGVHRLVLYQAIGPGEHACHWCGRLVVWAPGEGTRGDALIPDHLDGDKQNNDPANLAPSCHACNSGREIRGEDNYNAKLTEASIRSIRALAATGLASKAIAARYGVSYMQIYRIVRRKAWKHVT